MKNTLATIIFGLSTVVHASFNFGECSGSGTFEQQIIHYAEDYENAITVGIIPKGIQGLKISLVSDKDVDIRLYGENNDKIVHWPYGILSREYNETKTYKEIPITYSGYNGINGEKGHESIEINGTTPTLLTMKAFGYKEGYATVNYSWEGKENCSQIARGSGTFTQVLEQNATSLVGTIPPYVENLEINLSSEKDLDIQLYAQDGTAIVSWKPKGLLSGDTKQNIIYHDMNITWSGYNGTETQKGHEYITITPKTTEVLVMKVFGYEGGEADVIYTWGNPIPQTKLIVKKTGQTTSYKDFDDGYYQTGTEDNYERDTAKEVVIDHITGLVWQDDTNASTIKKSWITRENYDAERYNDTSGDTAIPYCNQLRLAGYSDWRLPTIQELQTIVDFTQVDVYIDSIFQHCATSRYLTLTPYNEDKDAWTTNFRYSSRQNYPKFLKSNIRCVRTAQ